MLVRELDQVANSVWTGWIQAVAGFVSAVVALVLLRQLSLLKDQVQLARDQIEQGNNWNRLNAAFTYFSSTEILDSERRMAGELHKIGVDFYRLRRPLNSRELKQILDNREVFGIVKDHLNLIEDYCTAVKFEALDPRAAYTMMAGMVINYARVFGPLIENERKEADDPEFYDQLERVAREWQEKDTLTRLTRVRA